MKYLVKITKWNQIKIHEFINFFFFLQRKDINDLRVINDTSRLLPTKGDPIITLILKGNVSPNNWLGGKQEKKKKEKRIRKCENVVPGEKSLLSRSRT